MAMTSVSGIVCSSIVETIVLGSSEVLFSAANDSVFDKPFKNEGFVAVDFVSVVDVTCNIFWTYPSS